MTNSLRNPQIETAVVSIYEAIKKTTKTELTDYEVSFIREGLEFSRSTVINNYAVVVEALEKLTKLESEFNYLIFTLQSYYDTIYYEFRCEYEPLFASFSRGGSPNQSATEASTLSKDGNKLLHKKRAVTELEQLIVYLKQEVLIMRSKTKSLDAKRSNTF